MNTTGFFEAYYNNARVNSLLIMDTAGTILSVNKAFTKNFGYSTEEVEGKNFSLLFTEQDKELQRPQFELKEVLEKGQSGDENYVMNNRGHRIWCTGESLLVTSAGGEKYIVKDIINLQAKKQLQLFLTETEDLLERIVESTVDIPIMILDGSLKIQKTNAPFLALFELEAAPVAGCRLAEMEHPFWRSEQMVNEIRKMLVRNEPIKRKEVSFTTASGVQKTIRINSKIIDTQTAAGKKIFIILDEINTTL